MVLSLFPPMFDYLSSETTVPASLFIFLRTDLNFAHAGFLVFSISLPSFLTEKLIFIFQGPLFLLFSCSAVSDSLWPRGLQHTKLPSPSPSPELAQTHVHWVGDAIQPSHPLPPLSPPAFYLSQHQGLFQWVDSLHQVVKVWKLQHQSFQWIIRVDVL